MNPHLPPDNAVIAALVLVAVAFCVMWFIEYWK